MPKRCCKAHIWPNGIFFSEETYSWDTIKSSAHKVEEIRYLPRWHPWNTIYRVITEHGREETYATHEHVANRNYRRWYHRNRQLGLCVRCSKPTGSTGCMCNVCREKQNENARRRRNAK